MTTPSTVIPEALEETLLEMSGAINPATSKRWHPRELAAWLKSEHAVEVSHMAVWRCLTKVRRARAEVLREVLRERLLETLEFDWENLDVLSSELIELADKHRGEKTPKNFLAVVGELRKLALAKARTIGIRVEVDGEVDVTSGGKPFTVYLPSEDPK